MDDNLPSPPVSAQAHEPSQAIFQQEWRIYRMVIDENYLFHREAYACLHQILVEEMRRPFRFLDVACGDAAESVVALAGTPVAHYSGIDLSAAALDLARQSLAALECPVTLAQADFVEALRGWSAPVDVVWIGMSLHHLRTPEKVETLRDIRAILGQGGLFLFYEPTSPDGEDREGYLRRWETHRPRWTAYTPQDWEAMKAHVLAADFPETASRWVDLGHEAGFAEVREAYVAPSDLFRLYAMRPHVGER